MRTLANDTPVEAEARLIKLWRQRTPENKLKSLTGLGQLARNLILSGLRSKYPRAGEYELRKLLYVRRLGQEMFEKIFTHNVFFHNGEEDTIAELQIISLVTKQLNTLKIPYYIGGSVASIIYGEERLTKDADLVIRIFPFHIPQFVQAFQGENLDFAYLSAQAQRFGLKDLFDHAREDAG